MKIRNATKQGYIEVNPGGAFSYAYPESTARRGRVIDDGNVTPTLDTGCQIGVIVRPVLTPDRLNKRQNGRRFKEDGEEAFTVTAQDRHGVLIDDGEEMIIRRLTPRECFRLQGWEDIYFDRAAQVNSDSQLYKQAGNGVTVNVIKAIAERLEIEP